MTTIELKEQLISKIKITDNNDLLEMMLNLVEIESDNLSIYPLNENQLHEIELSKQQIKNGEFYTHDEANEITQKWLSQLSGPNEL